MAVGTERKLAAIVSADVVGYSRLMGVDEEGTLAAMRTHRAELWDPTITAFDGRVVGTAGDSILVEFASAVAAVECSIAVQIGMTARNADVPEDRRMLLRVGVNIGEVIVDGDTIYGDGVNVSARLQAIAEPGGIAISGNVQEQIQGKLGDGFEDAGPHAVKNIARPIHVWNWRGKDAAGTGRATVSQPLALPDKPSIAVLPFDNMSGDVEQEYFADGITEDIITTLSKIPNLLVVARNSTFVYKGRAVDVKQVGEEQGVRCVLEGSVRKAGNRIRITVQLIDVASGHHLWAERYDREIDDIFALQDEISLKVVTELQVELLEGEMARLKASGTKNVDAWAAQVQAVACTRTVTKDSFMQARRLAGRAAEIDTNYASPLATGAWTYVVDGRFVWSGSREEALNQGRALATRALALDPENAEARCALGVAALYKGRHGEAIAELRAALDLSPNHADLMFFLGVAHVWNGESDIALALIDKAMRLSPIYPAMYLGPYGFALRLTGQYDDAIAAFREFSKRQPGLGHVDLAIIYVETDRLDTARREAEELLRHQPGFTIGDWAKTQLYRDRSRLDRDIAALRTVDLPE